MSPGTIVGLSIPTVGIYGMIQFYRCVDSYRLTLSAATNFNTWFFLFIGANFLGLVVALASAGIGWLVTVIPTAVFGALALHEALKLRERIVRQHGISVQKSSDSSHIGMWTVGEVLSVVVVGIVPLIIQALWFFEEHNRIVAAGGWSVATTPSSQALPRTPAHQAPVPQATVTFPTAPLTQADNTESAEEMAVEKALRDLGRLREQGLISDEEYEQKRAEILSRI